MLIQNAQAYASRHQLRLAERLGFGIHGIIFAAVGKPESGMTAIKAHRSWEPYARELAVYQRLKDAGIRKIQGFNVPQLLRRGDESARLRDEPSSRGRFSWILPVPSSIRHPISRMMSGPDWEAEKQEQFDLRWPQVQGILVKLEELGHPHGGCFSRQHRVS